MSTGHKPNYLSLAGFLLLVVGGGLLIGLNTMPGEWYAALDKPAFNPPNWIFGPVWTLLYVFIAVAGWLVFSRDPSFGSMKFWWAQLVLNFVWSPVFFAMHALGAAFVIILALLAVVLAFIAQNRGRCRIAALLFIPYAAWVAFASLLNGALWMLN